MINLKSNSISNSARIKFLGLSNALIKNLYIKILHLLPFIFLKTIFSHNEINHKSRFALSNVVKIEKFEYIYIDIYLIQIYHYSKRQSGFRKTSALIFISFALYFFQNIISL